MDSRKIFVREFNRLRRVAGLGEDSLAYVPHPRYFGTTRCAYCGERADTVDILPSCAEQQVLVEACSGCTGVLRVWATHPPLPKPTARTRLLDPTAEVKWLASDLSSYKKRRYFLGIVLRRQWATTRGPSTSPVRTLLQRRYQYALSNKQAKSPPPPPIDLNRPVPAAPSRHSAEKLDAGLLP